MMQKDKNYIVQVFFTQNLASNTYVNLKELNFEKNTYKSNLHRTVSTNKKTLP